MRKYNPLLATLMMAGGVLPEVKIPESNTRTDISDLPEGFEEWWFDRDTGKLISEQPGIQTPKEHIFKVVSRTKEGAIKEFNRLTKKL